MAVKAERSVEPPGVLMPNCLNRGVHPKSVC